LPPQYEHRTSNLSPKPRGLFLLRGGKVRHGVHPPSLCRGEGRQDLKQGLTESIHVFPFFPSPCRLCRMRGSTQVINYYYAVELARLAREGSFSALWRTSVCARISKGNQSTGLGHNADRRPKATIDVSFQRLTGPGEDNCGVLKPCNQG